MRKFLAVVACLFLAAFGISLQMKAAIGISPFDAMNQTLSFVFNMRVGDVVMFVQLFFMAGQVLLLGRKTKWTILLQVIVAALLGQFVNFFYYFVFNNLVLENYIIRLLVMIAGSFWIPIFIGGVMVLDVVTMPVENFAMIASTKSKFSFGQLRQAVDIVCLVIAVVLTFMFDKPFTIREGTIISAITFGPLLSLYMPRIEALFRKWKLVDTAEA